MQENLELYKREAKNFERIFKVKLMPRFWNHLTGFDVIEFDELVQPGEEESTADAVLRQYGQAGLDLCNRLLKQPTHA